MEHTNTSLDDIQIDEQHEKAQEELNENNVQPLSIAPTIGMVFETVNEVKLFYRQYAISKGFGIRTRSSRKNNKNELCYFMMVCSRAGKYVSPIQNQMIGRPTCANDCSARMIVSKRDDKWYISGFDDVYSHDLSPTKSRLFRGNKRMNLNVKRTLDLNVEAGVRINKSFRSLVCATGGYENMEFVEHDVVLVAYNEKKIPEKLQSYSAYKDIKRQRKQVVYNSDLVDNFVYGWERMITTFSLHTNEWFSSLYEERHRWVPCYLRNSFWAGMSTTQRSESMNAFFDGYINSRTTLQEFVKQYDNALQHKTEKETQADFTSLNTTLPCGSQSLIERQFQKHYTHAKFTKIQSEFRGKINCFVDGIVVQDNSSLYKVMEDSIHNEIREERAFMVTFQRDTMDVNCSCLLFEFRGIICRHCVCVLAQERVT
ncbi:protein FAR-RED ELONGATED HYPOCOTYL 3-like [Vigna angularis]|uniref:protein FAR-RED ELONGATED HYPOCOTYL 3-like n=1 Tax=Phaseolus angularis TaxID=3914 RepID=UPI00080A3BF4|nr:protein FAR-RED ELONGATED HYPOCOTYL 3-like [Vigna angularis]